MGSQPSYGQIAGPVWTVQMPAKASQNFELRSGKFVYSNAGYANIAAAGADQIYGYAFIGDKTTGTTDGDDTLTINISTDAIYELPLDAARTEAQLIALVGKTCDIVTTSNIQYADYDAATDNVLMIVGYRYYGSASGEQTLYVRMTPKEIGQTGVV